MKIDDMIVRLFEIRGEHGNIEISLEDVYGGFDEITEIGTIENDETASIHAYMSGG